MANKNRNAGPARKKKAERDVTNEIILLPSPQTQELNIRPFKWTEKQESVIDCILHPKTNIVLIESVAGCGKSLISLYAALFALKEKIVNKILYIRSPVESCDAKLGFLPSDADAKLAPYFAPAEDLILSMISKPDMERLKNDELLSILAPGFCQGHSFHNSFVVLDEAQQLSSQNLETVCSRFGKRSKMLIIGSKRQVNIRNSGFMKVFDAFNTDAAKAKGIHCFTFDKSDSMRSPIAEFLGDVFDSIHFPSY